jgi:hypothetical protein
MCNPPILPEPDNNLKIASLQTYANMMEMDDNGSDANKYCFVEFADKRAGVLYSNLTGTFLFMSLKGNKCFLIVYHYKLNAILALPIAHR